VLEQNSHRLAKFGFSGCLKTTEPVARGFVARTKCSLTISFEDCKNRSENSYSHYSQFVQRLFEIVYEDTELLVINKPAGLVCHPTKTDEYSSLISRVRLYLGQGAHPQLVNRLDRETSGVTIVAKSAIAARQLRKIWETRQVEKEYLAIVHGHVCEEHGKIDAPLGKDESSNVAIKDCVRADGASAQTEFSVKKRFRRIGNSEQSFSLLRVRLQTGRKHQIRIHLAHIGHPVVGDKLYGGDEDLYLALVEDRLTDEQRRKLILPNHALHAARVKFQWPGERIFEAKPEKEFSEFAGAHLDCAVNLVC
jgi:23S rRNA pseudouridine1911/1915/1917 synthase